MSENNHTNHTELELLNSINTPDDLKDIVMTLEGRPIAEIIAEGGGESNNT